MAFDARRSSAVVSSLGRDRKARASWVRIPAGRSRRRAALHGSVVVGTARPHLKAGSFAVIVGGAVASSPLP
eukprot:1772126-Prymnesium_polylepis.1